MLVQIGKYFIERYWRKNPASERRVCIHNVSCSRAVYDNIDNYGILSGIKTYLHRRKTCNKYYRITIDKDNIIITTKDGSILNENDINPVILKEIKASL